MIKIFDYLDSKVNQKRREKTEAVKSKKRELSLSQALKQARKTKRLKAIDFLELEEEEEKEEEEFSFKSSLTPTKVGRKKQEAHVQEKPVQEQVNAIVQRIYKTFTKIPQSMLLKKCGILQLSTRNILENKVQPKVLRLLDSEGIVLITLEEDDYLLTVHKWTEKSGNFFC